MRHHIAALDASTGRPTGWNPNVDGAVDALALSGSTLYAGGSFTSIGGAARSQIAALDITTGRATAWNANANPPITCETEKCPAGFGVLTLAVSGSTVYAGGYFTSIGGQARNRIAALDTRTGDASAWNPNLAGPDAYYEFDEYVDALAVSGTTVYAGGGFTSIGGQARNNLAALDLTTGSATGWNPNPDGAVQALALSASTVYVGGSFTSIGGAARRRIAALDAGTGQAMTGIPTPAAMSTRWRSRAMPCTPAATSRRSAAAGATTSLRSTPRPARRPPGTQTLAATSTRWPCRARPCTPAVASVRSADIPSKASLPFDRCPERRILVMPAGRALPLSSQRHLGAYGRRSRNARIARPQRL